MSFVPEGDHREESAGSRHLLYGSLPREPVCTENLTPFLKLLPCKGRAGIGSVLDGHKLFDAQWQSMSVSVRPVCDGDRCRMQLEQTIDMVLDIERSLQRRDSPVPRPRPVGQISCDPNRPYGADGDACFPQANLADLPWSVGELFGRPITGACPLTRRSARPVCAEVPALRPVYVAAPTDSREAASADGGTRCFALPANGGKFDLMLPAQTPPLENALTAPPLYVHRSFTGHGQERGGVQAVLTNPSAAPVDVVYLESLPWFMKPYLHTLKTTLSPPAAPPLQDLLYRPAIDRARGTHLEAALVIPANSTLTLTYDFDKAVLRYTEYPPDANRGFDIAPAIVTVRGKDGARYSVRTTSLLLSLPTPDFR